LIAFLPPLTVVLAITYLVFVALLAPLAPALGVDVDVSE
jgi:hypothetical protein